MGNPNRVSPRWTSGHRVILPASPPTGALDLSLLWVAAEELVEKGQQAVTLLCDLVALITQHHAQLIVAAQVEPIHDSPASIPVQFLSHDYGVLVLERQVPQPVLSTHSHDEAFNLARACGMLLHHMELRALVAGNTVPASWTTVEPLTGREQEIMVRMMDGQKTEAIAHALRIAKGTVRKHFERIYAKLHVHGRQEAIAVAHRLGLIPLITW